MASRFDHLRKHDLTPELSTDGAILVSVQHSAKPQKKHAGVDPESRRRSWLNSYEATKWTVRDSAGSGRDEVIDFDVRMADGRSLLRHADLYGTAKELLFWIRAGNYTRLDDAHRHRQYGDTMLRLCYGLTARGFFSFASLTSIDVDMICSEAAFGVDALLAASTLVKKSLRKYSSWDEVPKSLAAGNVFDLRAIIAEFNLPPRWARAEIASEVQVASARLNGQLLSSVADTREDPITIQNIQILTMLFEALFALRHVIEATPIAFRPFPEGAAGRAVDLGRTHTRTPIPPPELALRLMENSTRYLVEHCDQTTTDYRAVIRSRATKQWSREEAEEVRLRVRRLAAACYILIATFTARRTEEIKVLQRNCMEGNDRDGWWMKIYIEKGPRELTWIPVPRIVARAVNVLRSFAIYDGVDQKGLLFEHVDPVSNKLSDLSPEISLNNFARAIGASEYANDDTKKPVVWNWVTRQFRRFFAVLFFHRYRGKIEILAHYLRHFDSRMTNDYVTLDPDTAKIWTQEVWNYQIEVARDIVTGRETYSGPMGKRLTLLANRLRDKFSGSLLVVSEVVGAAILRQMKKGQLVLTPKPWVTCSCPRNHRGCERAACRKTAGYSDTDIGPDFAAAGPTVCPDCPFAMIGSNNLMYIDDEIRNMAANC